MKRIEDFTKEEMDAINLDDYEGFGVDFTEYPGFLEDIERASRGEYDDIPKDFKLHSMESIRKWWILTHPSLVRKINGD